MDIKAGDHITTAGTVEGFIHEAPNGRETTDIALVKVRLKSGAITYIGLEDVKTVRPMEGGRKRK